MGNEVEVSVWYDDGIQPVKDRQLTRIAEKHYGESTSSGCMMIGNRERDIQFTFKGALKEKHAKDFEVEVESMGYKIHRSVK